MISSPSHSLANCPPGTVPETSVARTWEAGADCSAANAAGASAVTRRAVNSAAVSARRQFDWFIFLSSKRPNLIGLPTNESPSFLAGFLRHNREIWDRSPPQRFRSGPILSIILLLRTPSQINVPLLADRPAPPQKIRLGAILAAAGSQSVSAALQRHSVHSSPRRCSLVGQFSDGNHTSLRPSTPGPDVPGSR